MKSKTPSVEMVTYTRSLQIYNRYRCTTGSTGTRSFLELLTIKLIKIIYVFKICICTRMY